MLACLLVLIAWLTGGGILRALGFAVAFFLIATAWSWSRWRRRVAEERRKEERRARRSGSQPARRESR